MLYNIRFIKCVVNYCYASHWSRGAPASEDMPAKQQKQTPMVICLLDTGPLKNPFSSWCLCHVLRMFVAKWRHQLGKSADVRTPFPKPNCYMYENGSMFATVVGIVENGSPKYNLA